MSSNIQILSIALLLIICSQVTFSQNPWEGMSVYCNKEGYKVTVQRNGCVTEKFTVDACLGLCRSYVRLISNHPYMVNLCQCCKATRSLKKRFYLSQCDPGIDRAVDIESAEECACHSQTCH